MATNDQILPTTRQEDSRNERLSDGQSGSSSSVGQATLRDTQSIKHGAQTAGDQPQRWWPAAEYGPLARYQSSGERLPAFGGEFQPGLYKPPKSNLANPAPLGLAGFALTTFVLSLINLGTEGLAAPNIVVGPAYAYGGLIQLLAGMWEIAYGNTFGGWALPSYGAFWIGLGIIFTPGGFDIVAAYGGQNKAFYDALGFYIFGWFIFTFLVWIFTLRSTVAFCSLFLFVWLTFLMLGSAYLDTTTVDGVTSPNTKLVRAGGAFGILAGFIAWWNMLAGIADKSNSFFIVPVLHFPWSEKGRARRQSVVDDAEKNV